MFTLLCVHSGVQWEATALEHSLLRLALVCFVGDTSVDPRDYARGHVYTPCAVVPDPDDEKTKGSDTGMAGGADRRSQAKNSGSAPHAVATSPNAAQTHGHTVDEFLALDEW